MLRYGACKTWVLRCVNNKFYFLTLPFMICLNHSNADQSDGILNKTLARFVHNSYCRWPKRLRGNQWFQNGCNKLQIVMTRNFGLSKRNSRVIFKCMTERNLFTIEPASFVQWIALDAPVRARESFCIHTTCKIKTISYKSRRPTEKLLGPITSYRLKKKALERQLRMVIITFKTRGNKFSRYHIRPAQ